MLAPWLPWRGARAVLYIWGVRGEEGGREGAVLFASRRVVQLANSWNSTLRSAAAAMPNLKVGTALIHRMNGTPRGTSSSIDARVSHFFQSFSINMSSSQGKRKHPSGTDGEASSSKRARVEGGGSASASTSDSRSYRMNPVPTGRSVRSHLRLRPLSLSSPSFPLSVVRRVTVRDSQPCDSAGPPLRRRHL